MAKYVAFLEPGTKKFEFLDLNFVTTTQRLNLFYSSPIVLKLEGRGIAALTGGPTQAAAADSSLLCLTSTN